MLLDNNLDKGVFFMPDHLLTKKRSPFSPVLVLSLVSVRFAACSKDIEWLDNGKALPIVYCLPDPGGQLSIWWTSGWIDIEKGKTLSRNLAFQ
jgi:hypothetical protein